MRRLFILVGLILTTVVSNVYAMPSFARQTGLACNSCHSQNGYPALNSFGRSFKASGYTMMGTQGTITDSGDEGFLSLPETLNASFVVKIRVKESDAEPRKLEFPDEAALVIGGRVAEHVGTFIEIGYDSADNKFVLANFKLPFTYSVNTYTFGAVPFLTDGFGPSASFEVLNTGAVRNARILEERKVISAQQYIGTATKAEGLGLYVHNDLFNVVYTAWMPLNGTVEDFSPAHYARAVLTPTIGAWDIGFGGQVWWGTAKYDDDGNTTSPLKEETTDAYAFDFQAMGNIVHVPVSFFATYAVAKYDVDSIYASKANDRSAATFLTELAVLPAVLMLSAGYRDAESGAAADASDNAAILGVKYYFMENVQFQFDYTNNIDQPDNRNQYLFMLYAAF